MSSDIIFQGLCGENSKFWSYSLTINTSNPELTECFQDSIITWTPCAVLWLSAAAYLPYLIQLHHNVAREAWSAQLAAKMILTLILIVLALGDLIYNATYYIDTGNTWLKPVSGVIQILTWLISCLIMRLEYQKGVTSSGVMFCFWLITLLCDVIPVRSYSLALSGSTKRDIAIYTAITCFISYGCVFLVFLLHCVADNKDLNHHITCNNEICSNITEVQPLLSEKTSGKSKPAEEIPNKPNPEEFSSFISRMIFFWPSGLLRTGWRRALKADDLWRLRKNDTTHTVIHDFYHAWKRNDNTDDPSVTTERKSKPARISSPSKYSTFSNIKYESVVEEDPEVHEEVQASHKTRQRKSSLTKTLIITFGGYYMLIGVYEIINIVLIFLRPELLDALIDYVEVGDPFQWHGLMYAAAFFCLNILKGVMTQQYNYGKYVTGIRVRSALTAATYRKMLRLSCTSRAKYSAGEITNLMQVDAQRIGDATFFIHNVWSSIISMIVAMVLLWRYLGPASMAGLAALLVIVITNIIISGLIKKIQFKILRLADERTKQTNEILNGIKLIKLYAWENAFVKRLRAIRFKEVSFLKTNAFLLVGTSISMSCCPIFYAVASLSTFVLSSDENILTPQVAFVSLTLVMSLTAPLSSLPNAISSLVQASVSLRRLNTFLNEGEYDATDSDGGLSNGKTGIAMKNCTYSWGENAAPVLRNVSMRVDRGKLVAVVGHVGSGKSSLLAAILGELTKHQGSVSVQGSVAYVPQEAWIRNKTLQENILFGNPLHRIHYEAVLDACALKPDVKILSLGDQTEIGEKGINLSGGQKQRVSVARAVYQDKDIYILDDPLSAVDAHVGKQIFDDVIGHVGLLKDKTRLLVTHGIWFLPQVDEILVLKDGAVSERGSYRELLTLDGDFADFLRTYLAEHEQSDDDNLHPDDVQMMTQLRKQISVVSNGNVTDKEDISEKGSQMNRVKRRRARTEVSCTSVSNLGTKSTKPDDKVNLITTEKTEGRGVKLSVVMSYIRAGGTAYFCAVLLFNVLSLCLDVGSNIWLSLWSDDSATDEPVSSTIRLSVYGAIGLSQAFDIGLMVACIAIASTRASSTLHNNLLDSVVHAPMSFFDTTPLGRILNRFTQDMSIIDNSIRLSVFILGRGLAGFFSTVVAVTYTTPWFLALIIPLLVAYYLIQRFYVVTSNQLRRLQSARTSPIYSHFGETITGCSSIRAYCRQDDFITQADRLLDDMQMARYASVVANRWLSVCLELLGSSVVLFSALFAVLSQNTITGGLVGLSVSYSFQITDKLSLVIQNFSDLETNIVAVERVAEYTQLQPEAAKKILGREPPSSWPDRGGIQISDYSIRYRAGLDLILKNISVHIKPTEKVGVVGRTGAGKSSLMLGLFRIVEPATGNILIDGQDTNKLGLYDLRSRLTIIPQDPVMFCGSVRFNLDPYERHGDVEVWRALEQAHLKSYVFSLPHRLDHVCAEGGQNFSVGQRQLVCLARALLRKARILVLDEATAAVDMETDELIQNTIRKEFSDCTILTIAHRLNTVMDYDRILVLDQGQIRDMDTPARLLADQHGLFYSMARQAGLI